MRGPSLGGGGCSKLLIKVICRPKTRNLLYICCFNAQISDASEKRYKRGRAGQKYKFVPPPILKTSPIPAFYVHVLNIILSFITNLFSILNYK